MNSTNDTVLKIDSQQVPLMQILQKAGQVSAKKICTHLKQQGISFERSLRIDALKATLRIPVAIRRKENANLLDKVYQRLSWFSVLSETQLVNYLEFFNHEQLTGDYIQKLWTAVFARLNSAQAVSFGKFLLSADEDFTEVSDIVEYNRQLDTLFYDYAGQIDGLTPAQLRPVLYNSSTIGEIKQIGEKYGVKIPGTINKSDLLKAFKEIAAARGLLTSDIIKRADSATVKEIEQLAAELGINIATKLNKEGIVEYLLQKAPQVSALYRVPLSDDDYIMDPPEDDVTDEEIAAYHRSSREFTVSEQLEFLLYLPGERLAEFFKANGIRFERRLRMDILKRVLSPAVVKRSREKTGGLDRTHAKLMWFTVFGETQLINMLTFFKSGELKARFMLELLTEIVKTLSVSGAYDDELEKLHAMALENVIKNGGSLPDIATYNQALNSIFYDEAGKLDGLTPQLFRKVKYNSSTVKELGEIAQKFGIDVPDKMEREDLAALIIDALKQSGKHTAKEEEKVQKLPFRAMIGYAKNYNLDIELGLNKQELIEFILKNAPQTADSYVPSKNFKEIKEAQPPQPSSIKKVLSEYEAQQKYTIVFERLGAEMFFDNDESYIVAAGEIDRGPMEVSAEMSQDDYAEMLALPKQYGIKVDKLKEDSPPKPQPEVLFEEVQPDELQPEPPQELPPEEQPEEEAPKQPREYEPLQAQYEFIEQDESEYDDWEDDTYSEQDYVQQDGDYIEQEYAQEAKAHEYAGHTPPHSHIEQNQYSQPPIVDDYYYAPAQDFDDEYEIIPGSAAAASALSADTASYTMFYVDDQGNPVRKHEGAGNADGSVKVVYHSQPNKPQKSDQEDMDTLLKEVAFLRERYAQLKAQSDMAQPAQGFVQEQTSFADKDTVNDVTANTADDSVTTTKDNAPAQTVSARGKDKVKKQKRKKTAAQKTVTAILITLAAAIALFVIYSAVTYFADIAFLAPINNFINGIKIGGEGLLTFVHSIIDKIVVWIKSLFGR